ncbi:ion channel [Aestuariibaculum suncheonense]|uniref:Ion transporter n=1 Tax=Aestuariibaculum suncheonense TaxID=1028745 RepID=A0A8J6UB34_9FLAO|nr:ion channel [Aestuariibaculum suncheonense]MBD0835948.1 ion transporter [Aestuariibaculum suncheonense]
MIHKIKDPGVGNASVQDAKRMLNPDGSFNLKYQNKPRKFSEAYHFLVNISWFYFFSLSFLVGFLINAVFALIYLVIGIEEITALSGSPVQDFFNAFFFSTQTFTTVGYGALAPQGLLSGMVASIESFLGLMLFAFVTGLIYGRFSKPRSAVRFSDHLILRDFKDHRAIMFRLVNDRKSVMIQPKISVTLMLSQPNNSGVYENNFYLLNLERDAIDYLPTTWTVVHELDEESPLFHYSNEEIKNLHGELIIMISYYDESFNQEVHKIHSYDLKNTQVDFKFVKAQNFNSEGTLILDYDLFDVIEPYKS